MIKVVSFSRLSSAAVFIKNVIELENAKIQSISWDGGRTKIILSFSPIEKHPVEVDMPYYPPSMVLEAISDPPEYE